MDGDLYDEFGNYIGPELGSDESEGEEEKYGREEEEVRREGERLQKHVGSPSSWGLSSLDASVHNVCPGTAVYKL